MGSKVQKDILLFDQTKIGVLEKHPKKAGNIFGAARNLHYFPICKHAPNQFSGGSATKDRDPRIRAASV